MANLESSGEQDDEEQDQFNGLGADCRRGRARAEPAHHGLASLLGAAGAWQLVEYEAALKEDVDKILADRAAKATQHPK